MVYVVSRGRQTVEIAGTKKPWLIGKAIHTRRRGGPRIGDHPGKPRTRGVVAAAVDAVGIEEHGIAGNHRDATAARQRLAMVRLSIAESDPKLLIGIPPPVRSGYIF